MQRARGRKMHGTFKELRMGPECLENQKEGGDGYGRASEVSRTQGRQDNCGHKSSKID